MNAIEHKVWLDAFMQNLQVEGETSHSVSALMKGKTTGFVHLTIPEPEMAVGMLARHYPTPTAEVVSDNAPDAIKQAFVQIIDKIRGCDWENEYPLMISLYEGKNLVMIATGLFPSYKKK